MPTPDRDEVSPLMTTAEVALAFNVDPKTVSDWAEEGHLDFIRTPGGHRRYSRKQVLEMTTLSTTVEVVNHDPDAHE